MQQYRSASQILFNFLPGQTVDLEGGVWKVRQWNRPEREMEVDEHALRNELMRIATPWAIAQRDQEFVEHLRRGRQVIVLSLSRVNGVTVEPFPNVWICRSCSRVHRNPEAVCSCGARARLGQMHFVSYHDCGYIGDPLFSRCQRHNEVQIVMPGTASAREIRFVCPTCQTVLHNGFLIRPCPSCRQQWVQHMVHRAASVFTPRPVVIVNAPTTARNRLLAEAGGPSRALSWVVEGMQTQTVQDTGQTPDALRRTLEAQGFPAAVVESMIQAAIGAGGFDARSQDVDLPQALRPQAEEEALRIAQALSESRQRITDLAQSCEPGTELAELYRHSYPTAVSLAGLEAVELVDRFPILNGQFGFTRGNPTPGQSTLCPYRDGTSGRYVVYGDLMNTEALFVRLDPLRVLDWLREKRKHDLPQCADTSSARTAILRETSIGALGDTNPGSVGESVSLLVHSYAHRFIRGLATFAGIDRNSISEFLVPLHLGFFVYAGGRSDFILGGLQAVFEGELHRFLEVVAQGETRCPMDPGCQHAGAACMGCLHLGEPSCRWFNRHLTRSVLFGSHGYLEA